MEVTFEVPGQPRGKERPRWTMVSSTAIVYTPRNTRGYEDMIRTYYQVKKLHKFEKGEALEVSAIAYYQISKNTKKSHKLLMLKGEMLPTKKPNIDNIMNYLKEILAFENWKRFNCKEFNIPISELMLSSKLNQSAIYRSRNKLKQMGLIDFKERSGNQSAIYKINSVSEIYGTQKY